MIGTATARPRVVAFGMLRIVAYWSAAIVCLFATAVLWGWWQIAAFLAFAIMVGLQHGRHVMHPWTWFPPFFAAYSVMYPASLLILQGAFYDAWAQTTLFYHAIALAAFTAGAGMLGPVKRIPDKQFPMPIHPTERQRLILRAVLLLLLAITAVHLAVVIKGGYVSKREIADAKATNPLLSLDVFYTLIPMVAMLLIMRSHRLGGRMGAVLWVALGWLGLSYLIIGERDILFRMMLVVFLFQFDLRRTFRVPYLWSLLAIAIVVMPVSQVLKGALIGGSSLALATGAAEIFNGEFIVASRNVQTLLSMGATPGDGPSVGEILLRVLPGTSDAVASQTQWYDEVFRPFIGMGGSSGWGFTMVGAGWLIAGIPGIVLLFALIGATSMWFYRRRLRSNYWYTAYLLYIPNAIYVMRADPTNYINLMLKTVALPLALVYVACWFGYQLVRADVHQPLPRPTKRRPEIEPERERDLARAG